MQPSVRMRCTSPLTLTRCGMVRSPSAMYQPEFQLLLFSSRKMGEKHSASTSVPFSSSQSL